MKQVSVSQSELAAVLDVSVRWIQRLEGRNIFRKKAGRYDLQSSVVAYVRFLRGSKDKSLAEAQRVHLETKTRKLRLEADRLEGDLIPKAEFQDRIDSLVGECEEGFRNLESRVVPILMLIKDRENEEKLMSLIIKHEKENCWRDLGGVPRRETPLVQPWEVILVCLGLIKGDSNGEIELVRSSPPFLQRVKVFEILQKYGSGADALRIEAGK